MALHLYSKPDKNFPLSEDKTLLTPLRFTFDAKDGGVVEKLVYLGKDAKRLRYENISIVPVPKYRSDGSSGITVKLFYSDTEPGVQPTAEQWISVSPAVNPVAGSVVLDKDVFLPIWIRFEIPAGVTSDVYMDFSFSVTATEGPSRIY